ncbi:unnamed protein product [Phytophthora lilii]|uniref:Unnamed protein product n=1 Tax=Phytophthora lilii TaxID=2077276 RepID=A0A9W6TRR7_9STRA|nr:unnamed protein product [Phytophthora lilii]
MLAPEREDCAVVTAEESAIESEQQQQSSDDGAESVETSLASGSMSQTPTKGKPEARTAEEPAIERHNDKVSVESDLRKALDWMQRDVERQARENRVVREVLARAILDISDVLADFVPPGTADVLLRTAAAATGTSPDEMDNNAVIPQLVPDKVDELVVQWEDALVSWREQSLVEKQDLMEELAHLEEQCLERMEADEVAHKMQQERLERECEDYASCLVQKCQVAQSDIRSLRLQVLDLSSQLDQAVAANSKAGLCNAVTDTGDIDFQSEDLQRQCLDLSDRVNSLELYASRCESDVQEQTKRANEAESRLCMLLEEYEMQRFQRETSTLSAMPNEAVQTYRQKLELLESRMQDVLQQVACDHEQFEYEQAKWAIEKRHHREKYDEVLDASVKVLKVLIIREKLMKKHERAQKRASQESQDKQLELACQAASLQGIANELMQQSAMVLLVLQQLSVLKGNSDPSQDATWVLPAKPVQLKSMIKRLRKIEVALGRRDWVSASASALVSASTSSIPNMKVCPCFSV